MVTDVETVPPISNDPRDRSTNSSRFLLAKLYLESIKEKDTVRAIRVALEGMSPRAPSDTLYSRAYEDAMHRIESQPPSQARRAKQVLAWITCAKRELRQRELQHALAVELDKSALDPENCPQIEHLVSVCGGLVTVDEGILRLVHYTTQDYFDSTKARWFPDIERDITAVCTNYLSFDSFANSQCETDEYCLYRYAAHFWGVHARDANADDLVLSFLSKPGQVEAAYQLLFDRRLTFRKGMIYWNCTGYWQTYQRGPAMHMAAYFGLGRALKILGDGHDVNAEDTAGRSALHVASNRGHPEAVKVLTENGADLKAVDDAGRMPLHEASKEGHLEVAKLLIAKNSDIQAIGYYNSWTPLHAASAGNSLEVAKLLIDNGADVHVSSREGTPLHTASSHNSLEVAKLLIEMGANAHCLDTHGLTPLHNASKSALEVATLLIEKGANVHDVDEVGRTPLFIACFHGNLEVAKLLVENGADINASDNFGKTPIHKASSHGYLEIVKLLIQHGADSRVPNSVGETLLHYHLRAGNIDFILLLLNEDTEIGRENSYGRSLFFYAVQGGLKTFNLLRGGEMHINKKDHYGCTLLSIAVRYGHGALVNELLAIPDIDLTLKDNFGRSAHWWARKQGYDGIAERLLKHARDRYQCIAPAEVELGQPARFGKRYSYCDVCYAVLVETYYWCKDCCHDGLHICPECRELGAHCLVETHTLLFYDGEFGFVEYSWDSETDEGN